jgi:hypothetical protein
MVTLRIEHPISDYKLWKTAFDRFSSKRQEAGVIGHRIFQPTDDSLFITLDLDFSDVGSAERFCAFLQTEVWGSALASPALAGAPYTRILNGMDRA